MSNIYSYSIKKNGEFKSSFKQNQATLESDEGQYKNWRLIITSMEYDKEMYKPNCVKLNVTITDNGAAPDILEVQDAFINAVFNMQVGRTADKLETDVAKDFVIMEVRPTIDYHGHCNVELRAYSKDYYLTMEEYCYTYLAAKLGTDIIANHPLIGEGKEIPFTPSPDGLQFVRYTKKNNSNDELKLPYLVQYNETFHQFITRVAHRCGEFLYYEDGMLKLGLSDTDKKTPIESNHYLSISTLATGASKISDDSKVGTHYDYTKSRADVEQQYPYDIDYATDAYIAGVDSEKINTEYGMEFYRNWQDMTRCILQFVAGFADPDAPTAFGFKSKMSTIVSWAQVQDNISIMKATADLNSVIATNLKGFEDSVANNPYFVEAEQLAETKLRAFATYIEGEDSNENAFDEAKNEYDTKKSDLVTKKDALSKQARITDNLKKYDDAYAKIASISDVAHAFVNSLPYDFAVNISEIMDFIDEADALKRTFDGPMVLALGDIKDPDIQQTETEKTNACNANCRELLASADSKLEALVDYCSKSEDILADAEQPCRQLHRILQCCLEALKRLNEGTPDNDTIPALKPFAKKWTEDSDTTLSKHVENVNKAIDDAKAADPDNKDFAAKLDNAKTALKKFQDDATNAIKDAAKSFADVSTDIDKADTYGSKYSSGSSFADIINAAKDYQDAKKAFEEAIEKMNVTVINLLAKNVYAAFYHNLSGAENMMKTRQMRITLRTENFEVMPKLGSIVTFRGKDYLVVKIHGGATSTSSMEHEPEYRESLIIDVIPQLKLSVNGEEKIWWIPAKADMQKPPKGGTQLAVVTANDDPMVLGRVRIRYPWQSTTDTATSPWIRVATPFATKNFGGLHFMPMVGDEVLIDYYNGNLERPFVVGALHNADHPQKPCPGYDNDHSIRTETGQQITFTPGPYTMIDSIASTLTNMKETINLIPDADKVTQYLNPDKWGTGEKVWESQASDSFYRGDITISDHFHTWGITGSTSDRSITIDSALGRINISALTGISINAPHADVNINAKNINLRAGNNISLFSGAEVARQRELFNLTRENNPESDRSGEAGAAKDLTQLPKVDFEFLRTLQDMMTPPVEGTLLLKSNRFIKMEAGDGRVEDPAMSMLSSGVGGGKDDGKSSGVNIFKNNISRESISVLDNVRTVISSFCAARLSSYHSYNQSKDTYLTTMQVLKDGNPDSRTDDDNTIFKVFTKHFTGDSPAAFDPKGLFSGDVGPAFDLEYQKKLITVNSIESGVDSTAAASIQKNVEAQAQATVVRNTNVLADVVRQFGLTLRDYKILEKEDDYKDRMLSKYAGMLNQYKLCKVKLEDIKPGEFIIDAADIYEFDITDIIWEAFKHIIDDTADESAVTKLTDPEYIEDIRKVTVLKIINGSKLFTYDPADGRNYRIVNLDSPSGDAPADSTPADYAPSADFPSQMNWGSFTGGDADKNNLFWKIFVGACKFYTDSFMEELQAGGTPEDGDADEQPQGLAVDDMRSGLSRLGSAMGEQMNYTEGYRGRILLSDSEYTVSIDEQGTMKAHKSDNKGDWE